MGTPTCKHCGEAGEPDGWSYGMHEAMAAYQTLYRMKPTGPHRKMTDDSFRALTVACDVCSGRGVIDHPHGGAVCSGCRGLRRLFIVPEDVVETIRQQVLAAFPDAAADPVDSFPTGVVLHDLARGVIVGYSRSEVDRIRSEED
jgi:hypothetical protein